jgi:hypothetical protein
MADHDVPHIRAERLFCARITNPFKVDIQMKAVPPHVFLQEPGEPHIHPVLEAAAFDASWKPQFDRERGPWPPGIPSRRSSMSFHRPLSVPAPGSRMMATKSQQKITKCRACVQRKRGLKE